MTDFDAESVKPDCPVAVYANLTFRISIVRNPKPARGLQLTLAQSQRLAPCDVNELLAKWISTAQAYSSAHRAEAVALRKQHNYLGAPSVALSAIVGTSIFAAIQDAAQSPPLKWLLAMLSMSAAALAALITFYNFAERSANHRIASEEYEDTARRLQILTTSITSMAPTDWRNILDGYSQRLEAIGRRADIPSSMVVITEEVREYKGFTVGSRQVVKVSSPKLQRVGFPSELEEVFEKATIDAQNTHTK